MQVYLKFRDELVKIYKLHFEKLKFKGQYHFWWWLSFTCSNPFALFSLCWCNCIVKWILSFLIYGVAAMVQYERQRKKKKKVATKDFHYYNTRSITINCHQWITIHINGEDPRTKLTEHTITTLQMPAMKSLKTTTTMHINFPKWIRNNL